MFTVGNSIRIWIMGIRLIWGRATIGHTELTRGDKQSSPHGQVWLNERDRWDLP